VVDQTEALGRLLDDYQARRLSRRDVLRGAAALGVAAPTLAALLAKTPRAGAAPALQEPRSGGTLREGYDLDFSRMDPVNTNWYDPGFFALYESLLIDNPEGGLEPQLATAWDTETDPKRVTFTIRDGAKFHSGRALDAQAVKEVYDAIKDPASASPLASLFEPVESIEAPDAKTLVLNLKHPYYEVLHVVKTGYWAIVNMETRTRLGQEYGQQEIDGSGPFTFEEWVPGSHVTVKRWEEYPGSAVPYFQNKGKAYLDGIRWEAILEAAQRGVRIENGEIDTLRGPALQDVARLQGNGDLNVLTFKEWSGYILGLNFERPELDFHDLKMRQAASHAIDRAAIVEALLFEQGEPLYGPINSADSHYNEEVEQFNHFDLDKAKALVAELGWTAGDGGILEKNGQRLEFRMVIDSESFSRDLASVVQAQLKELGMDVTVEALDRGSFFAELSGYKADAYIFYYLWPVPIDVVSLFVGTGNAPNWQRASVPEVDEARLAYLQAANAEELDAASKQFQLAIAEHLPMIPLVNRNNVWVQRQNVHGWVPHQYDIYPHYNDVWLE
jgi:peptide/nickel transport system substrate-binding protein